MLSCAIYQRRARDLSRHQILGRTCGHVRRNTCLFSDSFSGKNLPIAYTLPGRSRIASIKLRFATTSWTLETARVGTLDEESEAPLPRHQTGAVGGLIKAQLPVFTRSTRTPHFFFYNPLPKKRRGNPERGGPGFRAGRVSSLSLG